MITRAQKRYCLAILLLLTFIRIYPVPANTIVATIPVGITPEQITLTSNNQLAYVPNNNNYGVTVTGSTVNADSVSVINLTNNTLLETIYDPSFSQPYTITINPAGTKAYVTNSNSTTISIINLATNTVTGTIPGFHGPTGMAITLDGLTGYVNNYNKSLYENSTLRQKPYRAS